MLGTDCRECFNRGAVFLCDCHWQSLRGWLQGVCVVSVDAVKKKKSKRGTHEQALRTAVLVLQMP